MTPVNKYKLSLLIIVTTTGILVVTGLLPYVSRNARTPIPPVILLLAAVPFTLGILHWIRYLRGSIVLQLEKKLQLNGGEVAYTEPSIAYEIWIFCGTPLVRYYGEVSIIRGTTGERLTLQVPLRNRFFFRRRSNFAPIIWRLCPIVPIQHDNNRHCTLVLKLRGEAADLPKMETVVVEVRLHSKD